MHNGLVIVIILISSRWNYQGTHCAESSSNIAVNCVARLRLWAYNLLWMCAYTLSMVKVGDIYWSHGVLPIMTVMSLLWLALQDLIGISNWYVVILQILSVHSYQRWILSSLPLNSDGLDTGLTQWIDLLIGLVGLLLGELILLVSLLLFVGHIDLLWIHDLKYKFNYW
jgi:hypothetical protein